MLSSAIANAIGAAIGGLLLDADGTLGLAGWQWVFIATGIPAILLAPVVLLTLPRGPGEARWLTTEQKAWRSAEHTSELQSLMRISYAVFCLKTKNTYTTVLLHSLISHIDNTHPLL